MDSFKIYTSNYFVCLRALDDTSEISDVCRVNMLNGGVLVGCRRVNVNGCVVDDNLVEVSDVGSGYSVVEVTGDKDVSMFGDVKEKILGDLSYVFKAQM